MKNKEQTQEIQEEENKEKTKKENQTTNNYKEKQS